MLFAAVATDQGQRPHMEDTYVVDRVLRLVGVFDGHGGSQVAEYCAQHAPHHVRAALLGGGGRASLSPRSSGAFAAETEAALATEPERIQRALVEAFLTMDAAAERDVNVSNVGCTACVAICGQNDVWVANAGDSRAILCIDGAVTPLSRDHKPELPDERSRILSNGGRVIYDGHGSHRINGTLNVSRGIGDWYLRHMVVPTPEVVRVRRPKEATFKRAFLVIASDGLWDVFGSAELGRYMNAALDGGATVQQAIEAAVRDAGLRGSTDNITVAYVSVFR